MKGDPNILGSNPRGRPRTKPVGQLTPSQEDEYAKAKAGQVEWVSAAVAAYMLGISVDTLRKRRQRKASGLLPEWQEPRSNRQGARYRWSSVRRCAMPGYDDRLDEQRRKVEQLQDQVAHMEALLRAVLAESGAGAQALAKTQAWAVDEEQRVLGLAALHPSHPFQPMDWMEALARPWVSEPARQPYHHAAEVRLDQVRHALTARPLSE